MNKPEENKEGNRDGLARSARLLVRSRLTVTLATQAPDNEGPYASFAISVVDQRGAPLLLLSDLAEHSRHIREDPRISVLFQATGGLKNPLSGGRVSLLGSLEVCDDEALRERFLRHHPYARMLTGFSDFRFYRLEVQKAHLVGGFGSAHWLTGEDYLFDKSAANEMTAAEEAVLEHMNSDHREALALYGEHLCKAGPGNWRLQGCDGEGLTLVRDGQSVRYDFEKALSSVRELREILVQLAQNCRNGQEN